MLLTKSTADDGHVKSAVLARDSEYLLMDQVEQANVQVAFYSIVDAIFRNTDEVGTAYLTLVAVRDFDEGSKKREAATAARTAARTAATEAAAKAQGQRKAAQEAEEAAAQKEEVVKPAQNAKPRLIGEVRRLHLLLSLTQRTPNARGTYSTAYIASVGRQYCGRCVWGA